MKPNELFNHIWNVEYYKSSFDLDWLVEVDDEEKKIRLLFQPSISIKDWIVNIIGFIPVMKFPFMYCWGWKKVYDDCSVFIILEVGRQLKKHPGYTLEISGHSYGGAMSIIAAIDIGKIIGIKSDVITFGAPKPLFLFTSKLLSKIYINSITQYAHRSDIVTYMPPFLGYHNVKVKRVGKFSFKGLFDPFTYHMDYGNPELY